MRGATRASSLLMLLFSLQIIIPAMPHTCLTSGAGTKPFVGAVLTCSSDPTHTTKNKMTQVTVCRDVYSDIECNIILHLRVCDIFKDGSH